MANKNDKDFVSEAADKAKDFINNVQDDSKKFKKEEIKDGKLMAILSYIGLLALIPYFAEQENKYVRYHAIQGMNLLILEAIVALATAFVLCIFFFVPFGLKWIITLPLYLLELTLVAFAIVGIVNVCNEEAKELPLVGKIKLIRK